MDTNCTRLEDWLVDQPDAGGGNLPVEWGRHLTECATCAQRWQDELLLATALVVWRAKPPSPPATTALLTTLLAEVATKHTTQRPAVTATSRTLSGRVTWWPMLAASAALVIVGVGLSRLLPTDSTPPWVTTTNAPDASEQLAFTSTVGAMMSRLEGSSHDFLTAGQNALPRFPGFQQNETSTSPFEAGDLIDTEAPSAVLRYGQPLGQGVGDAFRFLQFAVPTTSTDAG